MLQKSLKMLVGAQASSGGRVHLGIFRVSFVALSCAGVVFWAGGAYGQSASVIAAKSGPGQSVFVENRGQWDAQASFLVRSSGIDEWITNDGMVLDFHRSVKATSTDSSQRMHPSGQIVGHVVKLSFAGSSPSAITGVNKLPGKYNYLIGNDSSKWTTDVPSYTEARSEHPYDGVSLRYYVDQGAPRYDVVLQPGADPSQVRMKVDGANGLRVLPNGNLAIDTSLGVVEQRGLVAFQEEDGVKRPVPCHMVSDGATVGFDTGSYDVTKPLVIDPLIFSTFAGGTNNYNYLAGVKSGPGGVPIIAGYTQATNFPTSTGAYQTTFQGGFDGFVAEYNASGTQANFSTFLGGTQSNFLNGLAVDSAGEAVVVGSTSSTDFPVTAGALQTTNTAAPYGSAAFVTKLNASGNGLVFSTYLAGTNSGSGFGNGSGANAVALDGSQSVFVTGSDGDGNFPVSANAFLSTPKSSETGFLVKLNSTGSQLIYGTLFGGSHYVISNAVAVDKDDYAYVAGQAEGSDFPVSASAYQKTNLVSNPNQYAGFVVKFNSTASSLIYGTYLSGTIDTRLTSIVVNASNDAIVGGFTAASNYPTTAGVLQPTFEAQATFDQGVVSELNPTGSALLYSTYFGAHGSAQVNDVALNAQGDVLVGGVTDALDFPTTAGAFQRSNAYQTYCGFLASLSPGLNSEIYSTLISGTGGIFGDNVERVALTPSGYALIAGIASSLDFPTTVKAWDSVGSIEGAVFVAAIQMTAASETGLLDFNVPTPIMAGQAVFITAYLNGPAPIAKSVTVAVSSGLSASSSISIAAGANYGEGVLTVPNVTVATPYSLTATLGSISISRTVQVVPVSMTIVAPTALMSNTGYTATVQMSGITGIYSSGKITVATTGPITAPASVTFYTGQTFATVYFNTTAVTAPTVAHLTATFGSVSKTAVLNVYPYLRSFRIGPASGVGGGTFTGYIELYTPVVYDAQELGVDSVDPDLQLGSYTFNIPHGATAFSFPIKTSPVASNTVQSITVGSGSTSLTASVTLTPPPLKSLVLQSPSVTGGGTVNATVTLGGLAASAGDTITLSTSNSAASVQLSTMINNGTISVTFPVHTKTVSVATPVTIKATLGTSTVSQTLTVNP